MDNSKTILYNRGIGDRRVRQMEDCLSDVVSAVNTLNEETIPGLESKIEFVTSLPASPVEDTLYFVYEE